MKKLYTDYPITEFGDLDYEPAPIRECKIIDYDGNKYCKVSLVEDGLLVIKSIKRDYIYNIPTRYDMADFVATPEEIAESVG